jgi:hypothetical protein
MPVRMLDPEAAGKHREPARRVAFAHGSDVVLVQIQRYRPDGQLPESSKRQGSQWKSSSAEFIVPPGADFYPVVRLDAKAALDLI